MITRLHGHKSPLNISVLDDYRATWAQVTIKYFNLRWLPGYMGTSHHEMLVLFHDMVILELKAPD